MLNAIVSGSVEETDQFSIWEVNFTERRSCWVYGGIFKEFSIMNWKIQFV